MLADGGALVIEGWFVADPSRFDRGQRLEARDLSAGWMHLDASRHDPTTQRISGQQIVITEAGITLYPSHLRYTHPAELDLMAQLAGLAPAGRWGGWAGEAFTADSRAYIACHTKPASRP
ncbi:hypothetical protein [Longispora albida]|uniref:hypothetical protein n=1 Tax=Longispora albida TaxID=203523 RepID=UPI00036B7C69|nr:hypothetical protein [Longispora albida]